MDGDKDDLTAQGWRDIEIELINKKARSRTKKVVQKKKLIDTQRKSNINSVDEEVVSSQKT